MNEKDTCISIADIPYSWVRKELQFDGVIRRGQRGKKAKLVQEWLCLHGIFIAIDSDFGEITEKAVRQFQEMNGLELTGVIDDSTFSKLVGPMLRALTPIFDSGKPLNRMIVDYARQHLAEHPREIGGENCGPWVRMYMRGKDGKEWLWCAGFACFIIQQAADATGNPVPIKRSFSCDTLAERAKNRNIFVSERALGLGEIPKPEMPSGSLFLSRRTPDDWTHIGIVTNFEQDSFSTIEGNTNDEGSREGYEVCARLRGYRKKDFIRID